MKEYFKDFEFNEKYETVVRIPKIPYKEYSNKVVKILLISVSSVFIMFVIFVKTENVLFFLLWFCTIILFIFSIIKVIKLRNEYLTDFCNKKIVFYAKDGNLYIDDDIILIYKQKNKLVLFSDYYNSANGIIIHDYKYYVKNKFYDYKFYGIIEEPYVDDFKVFLDENKIFYNAKTSYQALNNYKNSIIEEKFNDVVLKKGQNIVVKDKVILSHSLTNYLLLILISIIVNIIFIYLGAISLSKNYIFNLVLISSVILCFNCIVMSEIIKKSYFTIITLADDFISVKKPFRKIKIFKLCDIKKIKNFKTKIRVHFKYISYNSFNYYTIIKFDNYTIKLYQDFKNYNSFIEKCIENYKNGKISNKVLNDKDLRNMIEFLVSGNIERGKL